MFFSPFGRRKARQWWTQTLPPWNISGFQGLWDRQTKVENIQTERTFSEIHPMSTDVCPVGCSVFAPQPRLRQAVNPVGRPLERVSRASSAFETAEMVTEFGAGLGNRIGSAAHEVR